MELSEIKEALKTYGRYGVESILQEHGEDALIAALECGIHESELEDAYEGFYLSDVEFVKDFLQQIGGLDNVPDYVHIDWEATTRDIMMDYRESNCHYFRI